MASTAPSPVKQEAETGPNALAGLSNAELLDLLEAKFRERAMIDGVITEALGEVERRESFREAGATSVENLVVGRFRQGPATARGFCQVAQRIQGLPHLANSLRRGELSLDQVREVVPVATRRNERDLCEAARTCSVRELRDLVKTHQGVAPGQAERDHKARSLRCNDATRTMAVQLPPEAYAETKQRIESVAKRLPSDGETTWDQRMCDAFLIVMRGWRGTAASGRSGRYGGRPLVVAHAPLAVLVEETSELAGLLERGGLVGAETIRRLACDATMTVALDDDVGHTMFEGRQRRDPTDAQRREVWRRDRHCRFPGCMNATYADVHHLEHWIRGGRTDLDNLCLLCEHHHHKVHSRDWQLSGDANGELIFVGPNGQEPPSLPSPLWTASSDPRREDSGGEGRPTGT
jgi:hypothetical protein